MIPDERIDGEVPITTAPEAAERVPDDGVLCVSGFGSVGYPKAVPLALAADDRERSLTVVSGGSTGPEIDQALVEADAIARRFPFQTQSASRTAINEGKIEFHDRHISRVGLETERGEFGEVDVAVIEAVAVGEWWLIPTTSIGATPSFVRAADRVIVEVNERQPLELAGLHDVHRRELPPDRDPVPIDTPDERIGDPRVRFDPEKLAGVVRTAVRDTPYTFREPTDADRAIAATLVEVLDQEASRTGSDELRLQFGVGSLGNALMGELGDLDAPGRTLSYFGEVIQDGLLDALDDGLIDAASGTSLALSAEGQERLFADVERYADRVVVRPGDVSNDPGLIERMNVIAVNAAVEVDLYGHVNSTHVRGTDIVSGIGGSGDFNRAAPLSIATLPATAAGGDISRIVPLATHVDHTEHDIDAVVTEYGVADLRGLGPSERARELIDIAAPAYRDALRAYLERASRSGGHIPHHFETAFEWNRPADANRD